MHFQPAYPDFLQPLDFRRRIEYVLRMHGAERQQPPRIGRAIFRRPIIHFRRKPDYVRADIIDDPGPLDLRLVQKFQEIFRARLILQDVAEIAAPAHHHFAGLRLHHFVRLDVDVNINDGRQT